MSRKSVLIGMSGGVDSSVSAALLKDEGYAVSGAFLRFWEHEEVDNRSLADTKAVCSILEIPLEIIDARGMFEKTVIQYFLREYESGRTPNPCVFCNEKMKFKLLFETAESLGIEMVATGHYARLCQEFPISNFQPCLPCLPDRQAAGRFPNKCKLPAVKKEAENKVEYRLLEAKDKNKDQSYFLYRLGQEELARVIFPLGEYQKAKVRKMAEKFRLPVFDKGDSQDVCFMANGNLEGFLKNKIVLQSGKIIDTDGNLMGEHRGLPLYTIGQRKGIEIGGTGPYFVVSKNVQKNILVVTNDIDHPSIARKKIELEDVVWVSALIPTFPVSVRVRTRYHNPLVHAIIGRISRGGCQLEFDLAQRAIAPGQSIVFYGEGDEILGGGIIR
ncbi:MAG: tRNA 2-thiouridine(34) synthase MnmA [Candidatus Moraniibacteriota bacterium]